MKKLLVSVLLIMISWNPLAFADDAASPPYHFSFAPGFAYSSYNGVGLGGRVGLGIPVSERWYLIGEFGGVVFTKSGYSRSQWSTGIEYNFSESIANTGFVSGGVAAFDGFKSDTLIDSLFVRGGYRWEISEKHRISWSPWIGSTVHRDKLRIDIMPVNFTYFF